MKIRFLSFVFILLTFSLSCDNQKAVVKKELSKGKLFIIGGGKRPANMIADLIGIAGLDSAGYAIVLPMSSGIPDTASYYGIKQFSDQGIKNVYAFDFQSTDDMTQPKLDSLKNAALIYISGGNQNTFMEIVNDSPVYDAIQQAYDNGAVIAGTSAGAAVMSQKMISGNEHKHPKYTGNFRTIESNNIEIVEGLGLLKNAIIDQHFVQRMRMNRLISATLENPQETGIGIDESTAILVEGNQATVYGVSQVVVLRHKSAETKVVNGLLGAENVELNIYLPGDSFQIVE